MKIANIKTQMVLFLLACSTAAHAQQEILIPRSMPGDKGQYFLLEESRKGNIIRALHKRVGVDTIGYTITETNCKTMKMREIGYSEESPQQIEEDPTKWFDLIPGSSKSDLANFVCSQAR